MSIHRVGLFVFLFHISNFFFSGLLYARDVFSMPPDFGNVMWEMSLPSAREIKDQQKYPYCGLYAMSTYLEVWARGGKPSFAFPSLDPAFLAMGYNRVASNGAAGTNPLWLSISTQLFGAIPANSKIADSGQNQAAWPLQDWREAHKSLMDTKALDSILTANYAYSGIDRQFTGHEYLTDSIKVDFGQLITVHSNHQEKYKDNDDEKDKPKVEFRAGDFSTTVEHMANLGEKAGIDTDALLGSPEDVYKTVVAELYNNRPVFLSFNVGVVKTKFREYRVVAESDLVPEGEGKAAGHALVAVAHCDKQVTRDRICSLFGPYMKVKKVEQCVVVQNSWGPEVNARGYVCIAPEAFYRMDKAAIVERSIIEGQNTLTSSLQLSFQEFGS